MRQVLRELAACGLLLASLSDPATAQQGSIQVTGAAHVVTGDRLRTGGQPPFEPDIGVTWLRPGTRFGMFQMEIRGTTRDEQPQLGKAFVAIRDWKHRGINWTIEAGDTWFSPSIADYRLTNLATPTSTFAGASVRARTKSTNASLMIGRATAWRNIFGTDSEVLDQSLIVGRGIYTASERLDLTARASRIRTNDLQEFAYTIADSDQGGGGARFVLTPAIHLVADGSIVSYRRRGSEFREVDASALAGASVLLAKGWVQVNVSRFSPGELPVLTQPLADRQTFFAAAEYDVFKRLRLHGGWEAFKSNLNPGGAASAGQVIPTSDGTRGFAGFRVPLGVQSSIGVRYEDGDRRSRYIGASAFRVSDTGIFTSEYQSTFGIVNTFVRYARRENVETENTVGTYTQHDSSALAFVNVSRTLQLFGSATALRNAQQSGEGSNFLQFGGGGQAQLMRRGLWLRAEGLSSRNVDILRDRTIPHGQFSFGLNGEIARNTIIGVNLYADRFADATLPGADPWTLRSTLRVSRNFPGGGTSYTSVLGNMSRHSGTGSVIGAVFADWNANGIQDPGDAALENIPIRLANLGSANTTRSGEFAFVNVPVGLLQVGVDLTSLPVDFDPPTVAEVQLNLGRGESKKVTFGLVPLGSVSGRVIHDVNGNGQADDGEPSIDGAVLTLDGGARSEVVRRGSFRFDAIRSGDHRVELLADSLPEGALIVGEPTAVVSIRRDAITASAQFVVKVQPRPEVRRVFPPGPKSAPAPRQPAGSAAAAKPPAGKAASSPTEAARVERPSSAPVAPPSATPSSSATDEQFAIQIAAVSDPIRARRLVEQLRNKGYQAYVVEPSPSDTDAPYRIRIGGFTSRPAAQKAAQALQRERGQKVWVVRER
jgi:cell division septation protein DedD